MIGDNLSAHISLELCEIYDIHLIFLPPNSTHLLYSHWTWPFLFHWYQISVKFWKSGRFLNQQQQQQQQASQRLLPKRKGSSRAFQQNDDNSTSSGSETAELDSSSDWKKVHKMVLHCVRHPLNYISIENFHLFLKKNGVFIEFPSITPFRPFSKLAFRLTYIKKYVL